MLLHLSKEFNSCLPMNSLIAFVRYFLIIFSMQCNHNASLPRTTAVTISWLPRRLEAAKQLSSNLPFVDLFEAFHLRSSRSFIKLQQNPSALSDRVIGSKSLGL